MIMTLHDLLVVNCQKWHAGCDDRDVDIKKDYTHSLQQQQQKLASNMILSWYHIQKMAVK